MKSLMYQGVKDFQIIDLPVPQPKKGELLLKLKACGICGSDVHGWLGLTGRRTAPMVMGHEFSAEVVGFGEDCSGKYTQGDLVAIQPCISCWDCEYCEKGLNNLCPRRKFFGTMDINGAFQEYVTIPEKNAFLLPRNIDEIAGSLIEPFAVSYSGVKKAGNLEGKNVLIIGGGTIGLLAIFSVKMQNPKKIVLTDLSNFRLEKAKNIGADIVINPRGKDFTKEIETAFEGQLADVSIECVGLNITAQQSIEGIKPYGKSCWIGNSEKMINIDMQRIVTQGLNIIGSYVFTHKEFEEAISLISEYNLDLGSLVSKKVRLEEAPALFEELARDTGEHIKCVVKF